MNLAGIDYAVAALAFLVLSLLLLASARSSALRLWWIAASTLSSVWAGTLAIDSFFHNVPLVLLFCVEAGRDAGWLLLLSEIGAPKLPRPLLIIVRLAWSSCLLWGVAMALMPFTDHAFNWPIMLSVHARLLLAFLGLVLIEQVYRNACVGKAAQFLALGVGGQFAFDLYLYSEAELFHHIGAAGWSVRGLACALMVPGIAVAAKANREWAPDLFVSRQVVFHTTAFVSVGIYLCAMAGGGYYIRLFGGNWGEVLQTVFFVGAAAVLASLILSGTLRRRFKVFISKHFYRNKYDYRVEWLRFARTLLQVNDDVHCIFVQAVAQVLGSPGGALFVKDDSRDLFAPACVWPPDDRLREQLTEMPGDDELVRLLSQRSWIIDLREYRRAPASHVNIELPDWLRRNPQLRIVSPILRLDALSGFLVLRAPPDPFELTYEDRDLLITLGRHIATLLAQHQSDRRLAESQQFETYSRLTAFMMHDLKNSIAQLQLLVSNAARHRHNPEFIDDAVLTIQNAVQRITRLMEQLQLGRPVTLRRPVRLDELVQSARQRCAVRLPVPIIVASAAAPVVEADPDRLTAVIEHVIRNAQDATPATGRVALEVTAGDSFASVIVEDTGNGMHPDFVRERLFRPFDSTKGASGMGIGAYQVRDYVRSLGGHVEVHSKPGVGTRFCVTLPALETCRGL